MVVSSACITTARITQAVMAARLATPGPALAIGEGTAAGRGGRAGGTGWGGRAAGWRAAAKPPGSLSFEGTVSVTEINGSESFVHVHVGGDAWVCLLPGVHDLLPGAPMALHIDVRRAFVFDARGALASRPVLAEAV